jgi:hypothetical protein
MSTSFSSHATCTSKQCRALLLNCIKPASLLLRSSCNANADLPCPVGVPCAAVVVLSPEFVQTRHPMRELQIFLERQSRDPSSIFIIPVFIGLTAEQCCDVEQLYASQAWPDGVPELSEQERAESLEKWAAAVEQLLHFKAVTSAEVCELASSCVGNEYGRAPLPAANHGDTS